MKNLEKLLAEAIFLASAAHINQFDKGGRPYILHPMWVMNQVRHLGYKAMIVAILHDVTEDSHVTLEGLRSKGYPEDILEALRLLDKNTNPGETYADKIIYIKDNELARAVKIKDTEHNSRPTRAKGWAYKDVQRVGKYFFANAFLRGEISLEKYKKLNIKNK